MFFPSSIAAFLISAMALSMLLIASSSSICSAPPSGRCRCARASRKSDNACKYAGCFPCALTLDVASGIRNANAKATSDSLRSVLIRIPLSPDFDLSIALAAKALGDAASHLPNKHAVAQKVALVPGLISTGQVAYHQADTRHVPPELPVDSSSSNTYDARHVRRREAPLDRSSPRVCRDGARRVCHFRQPLRRLDLRKHP